MARTATTTPTARSTTAGTAQARLSWTPLRTWLLILAVALLGLAVLGLFTSMHGLGFHIEGGEDALHWGLAAVTFALVFLVRDDRLLATLGIAYGATYLATAVLGFVDGRIGAWHVGTADNVLHLVLGLGTVAVAAAARRSAGTPGAARA